MLPISIYAALTLLVALFLAWRLPNMLLHPNFYGEDGSVYLQNSIDIGWLKATFTPFNGYFIVGLYLLCELATLVNKLMGGNLLSLPEAFSWAAIIWMSAVICLPYLLFKKTFGVWSMLLVILLSVLVPLPQTPYAIFGIIGNQKFIFAYLAFLLITYRLFNWERISLRRVISLDLLLLLCAYTNTITYFLVPALITPYVGIFLKHKKKNLLGQSLKKMLVDKKFISLLGLFALMLPQVFYVAIHGIPKLTGYLDTPYTPAKTMEIFGNRTLLYAATHMINYYMGDKKILILLILLVGVGWITLTNKRKFIFFFGIYSALITSFLFVANRPGVADFFFHYNQNGSGPDQFFYSQTLIMYLPLVLFILSLGKLFKNKFISKALPTLLLLFLAATGLWSAIHYGTLWKNDGLYENQVPIFTSQALRECSKPDQRIAIDMYTPSGSIPSFVAHFPRNVICTSSLYATYQPDIQELGLTPINDNLPITSHTNIQQTFTSSEDKLDGLKIFFSNFGKQSRNAAYTLAILSGDCKTTLRTVALPRMSIDNSYYRAYFPELPASKNQTYCIMINPPPTASFDPIAVQLSRPNIYTQGTLSLNGVPSHQDLVFSPLFDKYR